jgi:putative oxidoreductase
MVTLFIIGRIIVAGYFLFNGLNHFMLLGMMSDYAKMKGVPLPAVSVIVTGSMLILGGLSFLMGVYPVVGVILIAAFLIPVSFMMHNFWKIKDAQQKMVEMVNFLKNMALLGSVLMFLSIPRPWPFSLIF